MKKMKWIIGLLGVFFLAGCAAPERVLYFQDLNQGLQEEITQNYEIKIRKDDILGITVSARTPELVIPFNLPATSYTLEAKSNSSGSQLGYQVDVDGFINFPQLGKIRVEGIDRKSVV